MLGKYKSFDSDLYEQNNHAAIAAVLQYIHEMGLHGSINDDKYGPDIVVYSGYRKVSYIEVERKRVWHGPSFPWTSVQLPERKGKFLRKRHPIEFWILNSTLDCAVIIPDYTISSSQLVKVSNSQVESGELFFQIPIELCILKDLSGQNSEK